MTVPRPAVLTVGDEIRLAGRVHTVVTLTGATVGLADVTGSESVVPLGQLLADPTFAPITPPARRRIPLSQGLLDGLPDAAADKARWWERHILEVLTGLPPEPPPGAVAKPQYDPGLRSMRQREIAKTAEFVAGGHGVALSTLQRLRRG